MSDFRMNRRHFLGSATIAGAAMSAPVLAAPTNGPTLVTSWQFGPAANAVGYPLLAEGRMADAVEAAINYVELLPDEFYVGYGGSPNEVGETTLDAMFMWGPTHDCGAVGCLKRVKRAISVARQVQEKTQHTLIVGDDATRFAARVGFSEESLTNLQSQTAYEEWAAKKVPTDAFDPEPITDDAARPPGHDTVGTMAVDGDGNICVGCSTNGRTFKIPGRVGDSPIAGAGAYCDNAVGAAIATGNGDVMMRFLPTYQTVENMRAGMSPAAAAAHALSRILARGYRFDGAIIALARDGRHGGAKAGWADSKVSYAATNAAGTTEVEVASIG
ncbi:N(4)-(beta-N-acetylglucosaminyl)-L-asparaginase [Sphingomicrobium flavum]|uniref:N(4)-(beta-N-acetylglucosaminyl)-L-asparaginase n=1 Tax=Sphingomicrobium flavum TaxID=1229164 RepID=UPI0021AE033A|nr:N(4)-(beta-N-acetylglucosaminyl)-L-asparaginase [Sphingomicrobium flavum]